LESYNVNLSDYDRVIFGFPVWASNYTPPLRTFIIDNADALKGKYLAAIACQSGSGGEKALLKLAKSIGTEDFEQTAIFIDPKERKSDDTDAQIKAFCERLK